jgi:Leucine-rich repeat (LRR) protein
LPVLAYGIVIASIFTFVPALRAGGTVVEQLKSLGAEIDEYGDASGKIPLDLICVNLRLWRGSSADLELIEKLPKYKILSVYAPHLRLTASDIKALTRGRISSLFRTIPSGLSDSDVKVLAKLPRLHVLELSGANITGAALSYLTAAKDLAKLGIADTGIIDADLKPVFTMGHLTDLDLSRTHVKGRFGALPDSVKSLILSGTALETLALVPNRSRAALVQLRLDGTGATDMMLGDVEKCPNLASLWLQGTHVTDRGLVRLGSLRKLELLRLDGLAITDAGLGAIRPLGEMRWLTLSGTKVTDKGLVTLGGLKKLETVILQQTPVAADGIHNLETGLGHTIETGVSTDSIRPGAAPSTGKGGVDHGRGAPSVTP